MQIFNTLITICWIVLLGTWLVLAFTAKKGKRAKEYGIWFRFGIVIVLLILAFSPSTRTFFSLQPQWFTIPAVEGIGVILCAFGVAFAIWARLYLGKNWGMPMTTKDNPELVTTGPYKYVRHPIYSGVILALLGSAFVIGLWYFLLVIVFGIYFVYSATVEEKIMTELFGEKYLNYKKHTKMIIPFIL